MKTDMRSGVRITAVVVLMTIGGCGQAVARARTDQAADIQVAQQAAISALNFRQGDAAGFTRVRSAFTESGWTDFLKRMAGFLDDKGAPTFTSTFVPRAARVLGDEDGVLHVRIPGTLTQSNQLGRTTYQRFAVDVYVARDQADNAIKIRRLEQTTCVAASTACN